ncbi:helix-turn-helix domain-containing protein [Oscillibacter sp.]|uniref:helix-turn-helix domain-containing protein n=1 Tax=Oscillibacter sp. TaxID=1945593 RepID=UPI001B4A9691|nr:S24 family peptidase [Oscillibacter sp.]MBP3509188.1 helix-turn-helix domain-containing protein [Oscillibacter sp.]
MDIPSRIMALIRDQHVSFRELSEKTGIPKSAIQRYATGETGKIPLDRIELLAKAFGVTSAYLMGWEDALSSTKPAYDIFSLPGVSRPPRMIKKPRLGTIACGKPILAVEEAEEYDDVPENIECDFTLRCKGDSMINARIYDGDTVYIRAQEQVENGEIAAVRIGDEATLKRVYYNGARVILRACNPLYDDLEYEGTQLEEIQVMGKAVAFTSMIR